MIASVEAISTPIISQSISRQPRHTLADLDASTVSTSSNVGIYVR
jgi:hypothetical protein